MVLRSFRARERLFPEIGDEQSQRGEAIAGGFVSPPEDPEGSIQSQQVRSLVQRFLAELSSEEREFVQLRFVEGWPQRELAEKLGIGRQRIRTREQKLKRRLLSFLRKNGASKLLDGGAPMGLMGLMGAELLQRMLEVSR